MLTTQKDLYNQESAAIEEDIKFNDAGAARANILSAEIYFSARWGIIGVLIVIVALGMTLAMVIAGLISRPVEEAREATKLIAAGDVTGKEIPNQPTDEVGVLGQNINAMQTNIRKMTVAITRNAEQIATASEEFSATSQKITANSEETSAQANLVSAATDEVNRNL